MYLAGKNHWNGWKSIFRTYNVLKITKNIITPALSTNFYSGIRKLLENSIMKKNDKIVPHTILELNIMTRSEGCDIMNQPNLPLRKS